jgi:hypothetical protein
MKIIYKVAVLMSAPVIIAVGQREMLASKESQKPTINTCSHMQEEVNKIRRQYKVVFEGFENLPMQTEVTMLYAGRNIDRLCQLGYITRFTPMGKEVCQGFIYTRTNTNSIWWNYGYYRPNLHSPVNNKSNFCRYVN